MAPGAVAASPSDRCPFQEELAGRWARHRLRCGKFGCLRHRSRGAARAPGRPGAEPRETQTSPRGGGGAARDVTRVRARARARPPAVPLPGRKARKVAVVGFRNLYFLLASPSHVLCPRFRPATTPGDSGVRLAPARASLSSEPASREVSSEPRGRVSSVSARPRRPGPWAAPL